MEERGGVRDHRQPEWFWIRDEVITDHLKEIGVCGLAIYNLLKMRANKKKAQNGRGPLPYMEDMLGISRSILLEHLRKLEEVGLISIDWQGGLPKMLTIRHPS